MNSNTSSLKCISTISTWEYNPFIARNSGEIFHITHIWFTPNYKNYSFPLSFYIFTHNMVEIKPKFDLPKIRNSKETSRNTGMRFIPIEPLQNILSAV